MAVFYNRRKSFLLILGSAVLLSCIALLPQSHELRYFLFIPLCWTSTIGMLFPTISRKNTQIACALLLLFSSLFVYMGYVNRSYYHIERIGVQQAGEAWKVGWWSHNLKSGTHYCLVDSGPIGLLLTSPTLSEFQITERNDIKLCPPESEIIYQYNLQSKALN